MSVRINGQGSKWIRPEKRERIYRRDGYRCWCGVSKNCLGDLSNARRDEMGLDHIVCSSAGGSNEATNLIMICRNCNSERWTKPFEEFYPADAQERIRMQVTMPLPR